MMHGPVAGPGGDRYRAGPVSDPQRILVFGGTFDPPHLAHTELPPLVAQQLDCDRILYIPAALNPLKADDPPPTAVHHRLAMLKLAIAGIENAAIDTIELERSGPSYMIDTLHALHDRTPQAQLRLLIGADQAVDFHRWRNWQQIIDLATPAVMLRPPLTQQAYVAALREAFSPQQVQQWLQWTIPLPMYDISSTEIRRRLRDGGELSEILSAEVVEYIQRHGLYRNGNGG